MRKCPFCGMSVRTVWDEIAHMWRRHPAIVEDRLRSAGMLEELAKFREEHPIGL